MRNFSRVAILSLFLLVLVCYFFVLSAPFGLEDSKIVEVEKGSSLSRIARTLKEEKIIRSEFIFKAFVVLYGGDKHLIPARYIFFGNEPVYQIAHRIVRGDHGFETTKVTIPEGFNNSEIAAAISAKLPYFNKENFLAKAKNLEGYLFPDTYFFTLQEGEEQVVKTMNDNYKQKIAELSAKITASGKSEKDIIIMASIIEREANGEEDRGYISGILWKRLSIGMPLQADAAPVTYEVKGLPEKPIGNPGLKAIEAALAPVPSSYLYYLHDKNGNIYYARSFAEHRANIEKYLK
jgi:UPF0755 protein